MLPGLMKGDKQAVSRLPRNLLIEFRGFTIIELVVASAILVILMSGLLVILQQGELTTGIGTAKVDLEAEVKMLTEWITKDIRQAKIQNLANNAPADGHLKFNLLVWNNTTNNITYSDSYIEYSYYSDVNNGTLVRFNNDTITSFNNTFFNITLPPFYTNDTDYDFNADDLLEQRSLIIVIKKEKAVRDRDLNFTMVEKVRIRNE